MESVTKPADLKLLAKERHLILKGPSCDDDYRKFVKKLEAMGIPEDALGTYTAEIWEVEAKRFEHILPDSREAKDKRSIANLWKNRFGKNEANSGT